METLGRFCCWLAVFLCFFTACSLPMIAAYLESAGPQWLIEHARKCHAAGHGSNLDITFIFSGMGLAATSIGLIVCAVQKRAQR